MGPYGWSPHVCVAPAGALRLRMVTTCLPRPRLGDTTWVWAFLPKPKHPIDLKNNNWLLRYKQNTFGCLKKKSEFHFFVKFEINFVLFFEQNQILNFFENTQKCFAYISVTKNSSEAVLYSKQTGGYSLYPYIRTIAEAFLRAE